MAFRALTGDVDDIIAGAAVTTLKALYGGSGDYIDDALGPVDAAAFAEGEMVGNAILASRNNDGSNVMIFGPQPASPPTGSTAQTPTRPVSRSSARNGATSCGSSAPITSSWIRMPGVAPDFLANPQYRADYEEVRAAARCVRRGRTAEQERIGGLLGLRRRQQPRRAAAALQPGGTRGRAQPQLEPPPAAELFAVINVAMADAGIDAWHCKYEPQALAPGGGASALRRPRRSIASGRRWACRRPTRAAPPR